MVTIWRVEDFLFDYSCRAATRQCCCESCYGQGDSHSHHVPVPRRGYEMSREISYYPGCLFSMAFFPALKWRCKLRPESAAYLLTLGKVLLFFFNADKDLLCRRIQLLWVCGQPHPFETWLENLLSGNVSFGTLYAREKNILLSSLDETMKAF